MSTTVLFCYIWCVNNIMCVNHTSHSERVIFESLAKRQVPPVKSVQSASFRLRFAERSGLFLNYMLGRFPTWADTPERARFEALCELLQKLQSGEERTWDDGQPVHIIKFKMWDKKSLDRHASCRWKDGTGGFFLHLCTSFSLHSTSFCFAPCCPLGLNLWPIFFISPHFFPMVGRKKSSKQQQQQQNSHLAHQLFFPLFQHTHLKEEMRAFNWDFSLCSPSMEPGCQDMGALWLLILWERKKVKVIKSLTISQQSCAWRGCICIENSPSRQAFQSPAWAQWYWRCWEQKGWRVILQKSGCSTLCSPHPLLHSTPTPGCRTLVNNQF